MNKLLVALAFTLGAGLAVPGLMAEELTLSDFSLVPTNTGDWLWQGFADTVMGGNSSLDAPRILDSPEGRALRLSGKVVTKGGGFIQVRLEYGDRFFDAAEYSGVEIEIQAPDPDGYYVFARTRDNRFPWSYYGFKLSAPQERSVIQIPWESFKGEASLRKKIRPQLLTSLAFVAAYKDFTAELNIYSIKLYK